MVYIYSGCILVVLCLILDEILPRMKIPGYFRNFIRLYSIEKSIINLQHNLSDPGGLADTLKMYIRNRYQFFSLSPRELFFREFQFDYSVSRYSVCPIHGTIELTPAQKVKITVCLNLTIPAFVIFICMLLIFRFSQINTSLILVFFLLIVGIWYYILIKKRVDVLVEAITRWLNTPPKK
ncbi:MAG: hypothetical protein ACPL28_09125 [bacterium]